MATTVKTPEEQLKINRKKVHEIIHKALKSIESFDTMKELYSMLKELEIQGRHFDYDSSTDNLVARLLKKYLNVLLREHEPNIKPVEVMVYNQVILVTDKNGDSYRFDEENFKFGKNTQALITQFEERDSPPWFYEAAE